MYTLGINAAFHDPAATLVKDGIVLAAAEEERFTHIKHAERPIHNDVRRQMRYPAYSLAGQTNLSTLGAVLHLAALLVSNDTGVAHLATACHTTSVILFTSASPAEWGPLDTVRHRVIQEEDAQGASRVIAEAIDLLALSSHQ